MTFSSWDFGTRKKVVQDITVVLVLKLRPYTKRSCFFVQCSGQFIRNIISLKASNLFSVKLAKLVKCVDKVHENSKSTTVVLILDGINVLFALF